MKGIYISQMNIMYSRMYELKSIFEYYYAMPTVALQWGGFSFLILTTSLYIH